MARFMFGLLLMPLLAIPAQAQSVVGDWEGTLKISGVELRLVLHVAKNQTGALTATLDSPDQGAHGIPVSTVSLTDSTLRFRIDKIDGSYEGKIDADGKAIRGTWTQRGADLPLDLEPAKPKVDESKRVPKPSDIDGTWEGAIDAAGQTLRLALHIKTYEDGISATMDSLDQGALGMPVTTMTRDGAKLTFVMKQVGGGFDGRIADDLKTITGSWSQGGRALPLTWKRAAAAPK